MSDVALDFILDPLDCPDYPVAYIEGQRIPDVAGTWHLMPGESLPDAKMRLTLDRSATSAEDVLVKNITVGSGLVNVPDEQLEFIFTWLAGELLRGIGQRMIIEIDGNGTGLFELVFQFNLNVLERPA